MPSRQITLAAAPSAIPAAPPAIPAAPSAIPPGPDTGAGATSTTEEIREALLAKFESIRAELKVATDFSPEVVAEAQRAVANPAAKPDRDETEVAFFTIDPPTAMDLDQALHIERDGDGYRVRYAIADLPAFVAIDKAVDTEARRRGQTIYFPDKRAPLHPAEISEAAASLLPGEVRPAYIWDLKLDGSAECIGAEVYRAAVRSVARFDYAQVQADIDGGDTDERWQLLREVGEKRIALEQARGGASLPMPEQEVRVDDTGNFQLEMRPPRPVEDWNAQISLLTGMVAADMMLHARVGILRTMPAASNSAISRFRRQAAALGAPWPAEQSYGDFLRTLDRDNPRHLALIYDATSLFRGAGYTPFDGDVPERVEQAAVADAYAHVTAPLRRLVDRFVLVICEAISAGTEIPAWVREALPTIPEIMQQSDRIAGSAESQCANAVEAAVLTQWVGQTFEAVIVDHDERGFEIQCLNVPVVARARGGGNLGDTVSARLEVADVASGQLLFTIL